MTENKVMSYIYNLSSIFYFNEDEYISCCRKNKNEDIWYYIYNGMKSEECNDIFNQLSQFENFQPVLLFYEYKNDPNDGIRQELQNENFSLFSNWEDDKSIIQPKKNELKSEELNINKNLNNENEVKNEVKNEVNNEVKKEDNNMLENKSNLKL